MTRDASLAEQLADDYRQASLSPADRAMLDYVVVLTREPWTLQPADIERLRTAGFDDRAILDMNIVAGYYAFVNRLAEGLGVPLEAFWDDAQEANTDG